MQTTLRIDPHVYRQAKSEAAREGMSLTRFIEEALRLRLARPRPRRGGLPVYDTGLRLPADTDVGALLREAEARYAEDDAAKALRLASRPPGRAP